MKLVLATSNRGKIREIREMFDASYDIVAYSDLVELGEIVEDGDTFAANAMIKARTVYSALKDDKALVLSDDSGISVDALDGAPGIYSARYGGAGASDRDNMNKLIDALKAKGVERSGAHYTAAISIVGHFGDYTMHGWMHGAVITAPRGDGGFGYDPMFIPEGYDKTLGELDPAIKRRISHRFKALHQAHVVLTMLRRTLR